MSYQFAVLPQGVLESLALRLEDGGGLQGHVLRLPHPRTGIPSLFLPHRTATTSEVFEIQAINSNNTRSWIMGDGVVSDGKLLVMTPVDPAFLLIPLLQSMQPSDGTPGSFRPSDDIFEEIANVVPCATPADIALDSACVVSSSDLRKFTSLPCVAAALARICDSKEITSEITVFRFSPEQLIAFLRSKVDRLMQPDSVAHNSKTTTRSLAKDGLLEDGKEELLAAGHLKIACSIVGQYLPPDQLNQLIASYDFTALDAYYKQLADEAAAQILTDAPSSKTNKKNLPNTKGKPGAKRKATSQGVEKLKKASTTGMNKLQSFFGSKSK